MSNKIIFDTEITFDENLQNYESYYAVNTSSDLIINKDISIGENKNINILFADISKKKVDINLKIKLGRNSNLSFEGIAFQKSDYDKKIKIELIHEGSNAVSFLRINGFNNSIKKLHFEPVATINNGVKKSNTRVEGKIININDTCKSTILPILNIADNDVISASHGAALGSIDNSQLYYLMSRGLNKSKALKLIVASYFLPTINKFDDEKVISLILESMENTYNG